MNKRVIAAILLNPCKIRREKKDTLNVIKMKRDFWMNREVKEGGKIFPIYYFLRFNISFRIAVIFGFVIVTWPLCKNGTVSELQCPFFLNAVFFEERFYSQSCSAFVNTKDETMVLKYLYLSIRVSLIEI